MFPSLPPDSTFPAGIVTSLSQNRRESKQQLQEGTHLMKEAASPAAPFTL
jgi:hypothetical protein